MPKKQPFHLMNRWAMRGEINTPKLVKKTRMPLAAKRSDSSLSGYGSKTTKSLRTSPKEFFRNLPEAVYFFPSVDTFCLKTSLSIRFSSVKASSAKFCIALAESWFWKEARQRILHVQNSHNYTPPKIP